MGYFYFIIFFIRLNERKYSITKNMLGNANISIY